MIKNLSSRHCTFCSWEIGILFTRKTRKIETELIRASIKHISFAILNLSWLDVDLFILRCEVHCSQDWWICPIKEQVSNLVLSSQILEKSSAMQRTLTQINFSSYFTRRRFYYFTIYSCEHDTQNLFWDWVECLKKNILFESISRSALSSLRSPSAVSCLEIFCMWGSTHRTWENGRRKNYLTRLFNGIIFVILTYMKKKTKTENLYIISNQTKRKVEETRKLFSFFSLHHTTHAAQQRNVQLVQISNNKKKSNIILLEDIVKDTYGWGEYERA